MPIPAGGSVNGIPCNWALNPTCPDWVNYSVEVKNSAIAYATMVLWSATGRQYGLCDVTVRPCGRHRASNNIVDGWHLSGGAWQGYIGPIGIGGCCGTAFCSCRPRCEVWLPGPVYSITEVRLDGAVVDPATYRVDNYTWLVRTSGECWPEAANLSSDVGAFEVEYQIGREVPQSLLDAAEILACEWAKATQGQTCRLPGRAAQIARQGVSVNMVSLDNLMENGFTGLAEVDAVIRALNPTRLPYPLRVMTPDIKAPRVVTS